MATHGDNYNLPCPHSRCDAMLHYPFSNSPQLGCVTQAIVRCWKCERRVLIEGEWAVKTIAVALHADAVRDDHGR